MTNKKICEIDQTGIKQEVDTFMFEVSLFFIYTQIISIEQYYDSCMNFRGTIQYPSHYVLYYLCLQITNLFRYAIIWCLVNVGVIYFYQYFYV